jgi:hypothetical protein
VQVHIGPWLLSIGHGGLAVELDATIAPPGAMSSLLRCRAGTNRCRRYRLAGSNETKTAGIASPIAGGDLPGDGRGDGGRPAHAGPRIGNADSRSQTVATEDAPDLPVGGASRGAPACAERPGRITR